MAEIPVERKPAVPLWLIPLFFLILLVLAAMLWYNNQTPPVDATAQNVVRGDAVPEQRVVDSQVVNVDVD